MLPDAKDLLELDFIDLNRVDFVGLGSICNQGGTGGSGRNLIHLQLVPCTFPFAA
jgi:hypothetical protein